jgi:uncharacterized protein
MVKRLYMIKIDAPESDYLYNATSQIANAGQGLYTCVPLYKDEVITYFKGEILSDAEAKSRVSKKDDQYFISMLDGTIMDSKNTACFAKYANDAAGVASSGFKNNAKISVDENERVCLIAIKNIKAGEEIFCAYGKRYWAKYKG